MVFVRRTVVASPRYIEEMSILMKKLKCYIPQSLKSNHILNQMLVILNLMLKIMLWIRMEPMKQVEEKIAPMKRVGISRPGR